MTILANRIQQVINAGYTQADIANAAHVSNSTVSQWVSGKISAMKIENALGIQALTGFDAVWIVTGQTGDQSQQTPIDKPLITNTKLIGELIALMLSTDTEGQMRILFAAKDTLHAYTRSNDPMWQLKESLLQAKDLESRRALTAALSETLTLLSNIDAKSQKTDIT